MREPITGKWRRVYEAILEKLRGKHGFLANIEAMRMVDELRRAGLDPDEIDVEEIDSENPWESVERIACRSLTRALKAGLSEEEARLISETEMIDEVMDMMARHTDKKAVRRALLALSCLKREKMEKLKR